MSVAARVDIPHDLDRAARLVNAAMIRWLQGPAETPLRLLEAMRYSLEAGGKRLRPALVLWSCELCDGDSARALPAALAIECVHTFSLIHDDLPALDNDDLRRGRPTVHKAHGEAMAILVGDGLMSLAFQLLGERSGDPALAGRLCLELARGTTWMIAGQVLDTLGGHDASTDAERLRETHRQKTGALITSACRMGAIAGMSGAAGSGACASAGEDQLLHITRYGHAVGLMFQLVDDLLDVEQSTEQLGKRSGKDAEAGKLTYPGVMGVEASRREADRLLEDARRAAERFGESGVGLVRLAESMARRDR